MIKAGNQTPNSFRIGDFGTVYQMIGRVSRKTEADSLAFVNSFNKIAQEKGLKNAEDLKTTSFLILMNLLDSKTRRFFQKI
jgi:UPF0755 protein